MALPRPQVLPPRAPGSVSPVLPLGDDASLAAALRAGHPAAPTVLFDRHAEHVQRILVRILGLDGDLADLLQEVFLRALQEVGQLRDESKLKGWLTGIAVFTAREHLRRRMRRRWLRFLPFEELPEQEAPQPSHEIGEALQCTYQVLEQLPAEERIAFALRFVDQMELTEVAQACNVSLATIKRRLARAQKRFGAIARRYPALEEWVGGGVEWDPQ